MYNGANILGKWQEWYEDGQIKTDGQYDYEIPGDSLLYFGVSKMQGYWKYYDPTGKLILTEKYVNDIVVESMKQN